jgi:hypothetical protein
VRRSVLIALFAFAALAAGCDDGTFQIDPILARDTVEMAAPIPANAGLPSALDIVALQGVIGGGRFPERPPARPQDPVGWDFLVRLQGGEVQLVPAGAVGVTSRAALTAPQLGRSFEQVVEAPGQVSFRMDTAFALQVGQTYVARSREAGGGPFGGGCQQFAKLQPLEIDPVLGRVRLRITTNERCSDPRLAEEG